MSSPTSPALTTTLTTVRTFSDAALQSAIDKAIVDLPPEKQGAFIAHADGAGGLTVSVAERLGPHITLAAVAIYPWGGKLSGAVEVLTSWP